MATKIPVLPVIFRAEKSGDSKGEVTAVFPTLGGTGAHDFTVYAHIGQHSSGTRGWYNQTRAARPDEYASLLSELRRIYERGEDAVKLRVTERFSSAHDSQRRREHEEQRAAAAGRHESGGNPARARRMARSPSSGEIFVETPKAEWTATLLNARLGLGPYPLPQGHILFRDHPYTPTQGHSERMEFEAAARYRAIRPSESRASASKHESGGNPRVVVGKTDERVLRAFVDKRAMSGLKYTTDGKRLDAYGLGGSNIASWEAGPRGGVPIIVLHDTGGKREESIHRKIRKIAGPIAKYEWDVTKFAPYTPGAAKHESGNNPSVRSPKEINEAFARAVEREKEAKRAEAERREGHIARVRREIGESARRGEQPHLRTPEDIERTAVSFGRVAHFEAERERRAARQYSEADRKLKAKVGARGASAKKHESGNNPRTKKHPLDAAAVQRIERAAARRHVAPSRSAKGSRKRAPFTGAQRKQRGLAPLDAGLKARVDALVGRGKK